jgi:O-antigen/teichoic acid export membrane protein
VIAKYVRTFSGSSFQIIVNQVLGLVFFMMMALYLPKDLFGELNWAVAIGYTISVVLTFGFDHVVVRRIASGADAYETAGSYLTHALVVASLAAALLLAHRYVYPGIYAAHQLLLIVMGGSLFSYASSPYRQLANGLQKFWHLAFMNVSGNVVKVAGMAVMVISKAVTLENLGLLFLLSGIIELLLSIILTQHFFRKMVLPVFNRESYRVIFREALPQMGVILLDSAFARMDWILMGLLSTNVFTADYSFAYKAYDSSRLPLLIIAPVLLPIVAKLYGKGSLEEKNVQQLKRLWIIESLVCVLIPLVLNVCWVDLINIATRNRYGESTFYVYFILSLAMPMLYINNFLWTVAFSQKRLKTILFITAVALSSNLLLNIILIPRLAAIGAAIACTGSIIIQTTLYVVTRREARLYINIWLFVKTSALAMLVGLAFHYLDMFWLLKAILAVVTYVVIAYFAGMMKHVFSLKELKSSND